MDERRRFRRWNTEGEKVKVLWEGVKEEREIIDISAGGMKISSPRPVSVGTFLDGEFEIHPKLGRFFIKGEVSRCLQKEENGDWEVAVKFNKVSTLPINN